MVDLITALSSLLASLALLGAVLFLHRIARPLGHALTNLSLNAAGKRIVRLLKLAEDSRSTLSEPNSDDSL